MLRFRLFLPFGVLVSILWIVGFAASKANSAHQTETVSPIVVDGDLPYTVELVELDFTGVALPTLHSFAAATHNGNWVLIGGRTNGLHGFNAGGFGNFPPAAQNRDVWVVDPVTRQSWSRELEESSSGLTTAQIDALTSANQQFCEHDGRLFITGGYGFAFSSGEFRTHDMLTAIDLNEMIAWTQGGSGTAADHIRQLVDPLFQVTGGAMYRLGSRFHLVFGQNFQGGYNPLREGTYVRAVRSFEIVDDGSTLVIQNSSQTTPSDDYRRRDLNVLPIIKRMPGGGLEGRLLALSGVFTLTNGAWTVPVEIDANGTPSMADPAAASTFKQSLNLYHSAKLGMYSEQTETMHLLLFGGITLEYFDRTAGETITDDQMPFTNQLAAITISATGDYEQHLLPVTYPVIDSGNGSPLRFGANAEFFPAEGIGSYSNGVLQLDAITTRTTVGYIFGGIASDAGNNGNSAASARIFEVVVTPVTNLLADFDSDGDVDGQDFLIWQGGFGTLSGAAKSDGDGDGDGDVDGQDFLIWQSEFGSTISGAAALASPGPAPILAPLRILADTVRHRAARDAFDLRKPNRGTGPQTRQPR